MQKAEARKTHATHYVCSLLSNINAVQYIVWSLEDIQETGWQAGRPYIFDIRYTKLICEGIIRQVKTQKLLILRMPLLHIVMVVLCNIPTFSHSGVLSKPQHYYMLRPKSKPVTLKYKYVVVVN